MFEGHIRTMCYALWQAQLEMQSIPEAPSVRAKAAGDTAQDAASPFTPAGQKLPSIPSTSFHTASSGAQSTASDVNAADADPQPADAGPSGGPAAWRAPVFAASHGTGEGPNQALAGDSQRRLRADALQGHAVSLKARDSASSLGSQQSISRSALGSLAEGAAEGHCAKSCSESPSAARAALAQPSQPEAQLPGQVHTRAGDKIAAMPSPFASAAGGGSAAQSRVGSEERGEVNGGVNSNTSVASDAVQNRTKVAAIAQSPASVSAVLAGESQATNPAALKELLELNGVLRLP